MRPSTTQYFQRSHPSRAATIQAAPHRTRLTRLALMALALFSVVSAALPAHATTMFDRILGLNTPIQERGSSLEPTRDRGYILAGTWTDSTGQSFVQLTKTDFLGATQWTKIYRNPATPPPPGDYIADCVRQTTDGGYIVSGRRRGANNGFNIFLLKVDGAGAVQATRSYRADNIVGPVTAVRQVSSSNMVGNIKGGYILSANILTAANGQQGGVLVRAAPNLNLLWSYVYTGPAGAISFTEFNDVREDPGRNGVGPNGTLTNGFIVVGTHRLQTPNPLALLVWVDPLGNLVQSDLYGTPNESYQRGALELTANNEIGFNGGLVQGAAGPGIYLYRVSNATATRGVPTTVFRQYPNRRWTTPSMRETPLQQLLFQTTDNTLMYLMRDYPGATPLCVRYPNGTTLPASIVPALFDGGYAFLGTTNQLGSLDYRFLKTDPNGMTCCDSERDPLDKVDLRPTYTRIDLARRENPQQIEMPLKDFRIELLNTPCCVEPPCIHFPAGLTSWFPFDENGGGIALDVISAPNGVKVGGPLTQLGQYVNNSLAFNGVSQFVAKPSHISVLPGTGDFSIDCWVNHAGVTGANSIQIIVDKFLTLGWHGFRFQWGYRLYLDNGILKFALGTGTQFSIHTAGPITPGTWHLVAVTVQRGNPNASIQFYVDGVPVGGPSVAPHNPLQSPNNGMAYVIGRASQTASGFYRGLLDEVEFFKRALSPAEVFGLWQADTSGKCKCECMLPGVSVFCLNVNTITVNAQICNRTPDPKTFAYHLMPLPIGPGCNVAGPTIFTPSTPQTITVPPNSCVMVPITIQRPAWMNFNGAIGCYQFVLEDTATGEVFLCTGQVIYTTRLCIDWNPDTIGVATGIPTRIGPLHLSNMDTQPLAIPYRISVVGEDDEPDTQTVGLNGLPPGVPVTGRLVLEPDQSIDLDLVASFFLPEPGRPLTVLIEADLDGDGEFEPLDSRPIQNVFTDGDAVGSLQGQIRLEEHRPAGVPVTLTFTSQTNNTVFTRETLLESEGLYRVNGIPRDTYVVRIKGRKWLATAILVNVDSDSVSGEDAFLRGGDANNDNSADALDLAELITSFNLSEGDPGYSEAADFNGDGSDDALDLAILITNFNLEGDP